MADNVSRDQRSPPTPAPAAAPVRPEAGGMLAAAVASLGPALVQRKLARRRVQRSAGPAGAGATEATAGGPAVHEVAAAGVSGASQPLPHLEQVQASFGRHAIDGVRAYTGEAAAEANHRLGALAYATGDQVAFHGEPSLHTAAHEAAHVVQQRAGVALKDGVGEQGDPFEEHANRVAALVVEGRSAEPELDRFAGAAPAAPSASRGAVQRFEANEHADLGDATARNLATPDGLSLEAQDFNRLGADVDPTRGGGQFGEGKRGLSMDLRVRNPSTNLPLSPERREAVPLSYGEMVALSGDLYYSLDNMKLAPADEVRATRDLVAEQQRAPTAKDYDTEFQRVTRWRSEGIYQPGTGDKEGVKAQYWGSHPQGNDKASFMELATGNAAHFAAASSAQLVASPAGPEGNAAANNHQAWLTDHERAIAIARQVRSLKQGLGLIPGSGSPQPASLPGGAVPPGPAPASTPGAPPAGPDGGVAPAGVAPAGGGPPAVAPGAPSAAPGGADWHALENDAYLHNAAADHYLTDAFSAGHLVDPVALAPVTDRVLNEGAFDGIVDLLAPYAMKDNSINWTKWVLGVGFALESWAVKPKLRSALSVFRTNPDMRHSVGLKLVHDWLNENGADVASVNGRFRWKTMGDAHIDAVTRDIASRAVLASRNHIRALLNDPDAALARPENADDAWSYTPNVDATAYAPLCEAGLRYKLGQGQYLWDLLKKAKLAIDEQEEQKKVEQGTQQAARQDAGGDWGRQPSNARFTRRMIVTGSGK